MVSQDTIRHIAKLAKLHLSEGEVEAYAKHLSSVLEYFQQISRIDTAGTEPLVNPTEPRPLDRADEARTFGPGVEAIIENAPDRSGNLFKVPPVVG